MLDLDASAKPSAETQIRLKVIILHHPGCRCIEACQIMSIKSTDDDHLLQRRAQLLSSLCAPRKPELGSRLSIARYELQGKPATRQSKAIMLCPKYCILMMELGN